jgi:hypothetical protein
MGRVKTLATDYTSIQLIQMPPPALMFHKKVFRKICAAKTGLATEKSTGIAQP